MQTKQFTERLDEMRRILIDADTRRILNWGYNVKLCYFVNTLARTVVLNRSVNGTLEIDSFGRVTLPVEMMEQVAWGIGDVVNLSPNIHSNTLKLSMERKHNPQCILCERPEKIITINNKDVCKHCAADIARVKL